MLRHANLLIKWWLIFIGFIFSRHVLLNVELSMSNKEALFTHHTENGGEIYVTDNVSALAWVSVDLKEDNHVETEFAFVCYFPEEQGETYIPEELVTEKFKIECADFVREHLTTNSMHESRKLDGREEA